MERRKRILVVDDERANRELLEAFLVGMGHDVDMVSDGAEALAALDRSHDLVLLDVMMPGLNGFEVAQRIRTESSVSDIPICMVTALSDMEQRLRAVEAGADDFIAKPIDKTELKIRTTALLKIKASQDAIKEYQAKLKAQNRVLEENIEQLRELSNLKDEFIGIASHDLKNPLTGILGFATILDQSLTTGTVMSETPHSLLGLIIKNARIMQKIITDFLDFRAMEDGQITLNLESVDLNAMAGHSLEHNLTYAKSKGITLAMQLSENLPPVLADSARIRQVVDNLVGNAIKFSGKNGRVSLLTRISESNVLFEVSDCGPGLTDEDLQKIFVKYAKLSNKPTAGEKSSGLGLAICKKMIDLSGGEIGGRNNPEGGAAFWFKLPISSQSSSYDGRLQA